MQAAPQALHGPRPSPAQMGRFGKSHFSEMTPAHIAGRAINNTANPAWAGRIGSTFHARAVQTPSSLNGRTTAVTADIREFADYL